MRGKCKKYQCDGRVMFLQASKQKKTANKSAASTAKDRLTESVLNKQTEVHH